MDSLKVAALGLRAQRSMPSLKDATKDWRLPDMPEMPTLPSSRDVTDGVSNGWNSVRQRFMGEGTPASTVRPRPSVGRAATVPEPASNANATTTGSMWNRVLAAVHLPTLDDGYESDRDGYQGETHLTRVMKEYYVSKVQHASQLPSWLFPPEQRTTYQREPEPSTYSRDARPRPRLTDHSAHSSSSSILTDVPTPSTRYARKPSLDTDSGYSSSGSYQQAHGTPPSMSRTGSRTSEKLRAMRRPQDASRLGA